MTQNFNSAAAEVWRRMIGMYGADTVARKYGDAIPEEWTAMLTHLSEFQVQRGIRMLAYSGKANVPSLPEFVKLCRDAEHDREVSDRPALPNPETWQGDEWDSAANTHLLGHIRRTLSKNSKCYGRPASYLAMRDPKRIQDKRSDASPEFIRAVGLLGDFKKLWARDMREGKTDPVTGEIQPYTVAEQQAAWADCMARAEAAIEQKAAA